MSLKRSDADKLSQVLAIILKSYGIESFLLLTVSKQIGNENAVLDMVGKSLTPDGKIALSNLSGTVEAALKSLGAKTAESGFNLHENNPAGGESGSEPSLKKSRLDPSPN